MSTDSKNQFDTENGGSYCDSVEDSSQRKSPYTTHRTIFCVLVFLVLASFHWVMVARNADQLGIFNVFENSRFGPYGDLAFAFLDGHFYVSAEPDPRLEACSNPYLPEVRGDIPVFWDYSYYKNHYYLYFGPVPVLELDIPWHFITGGCLLPEQSMALAYAVINLAFFFLLIRGLIVHFFPVTPSWLETLIYLIYGLTNFLFFIESRVTIYEVALAGSCAHVTAALYCAFRVLTSKNHKIIWLTVTSILIGLGAGCKATIFLLYPVVFGLFAYVCYLFYIGGTSKSLAYRNIAFSTLGLFLPSFLAYGLTSWYNYERFDSISNFGWCYQMNDGLGYHQVMIVPTLIPDGIWRYYFSPWILDYYNFPYIHMRSDIYLPLISSPTRPSQDYAGLFTNFPVGLLIFAAPYFVWKSRNPSLTVFSAVVLGWAVTICVLITAFLPITGRYEVELQLPILYGAAIGLLAYRHLKPIIWPYRILLFALFFYSVFFGLLWGVLGEDYWLCKIREHYMDLQGKSALYHQLAPSNTVVSVRLQTPHYPQALPSNEKQHRS